MELFEALISSLQLYLITPGWPGVEERDVLPDHQVQHQAEGGAAEEQGAAGGAGKAAGQASCKPGISARFATSFLHRTC